MIDSRTILVILAFLCVALAVRADERELNIAIVQLPEDLDERQGTLLEDMTKTVGVCRLDPTREITAHLSQTVRLGETRVLDQTLKVAGLSVEIWCALEPESDEEVPMNLRIAFSGESEDESGVPVVARSAIETSVKCPVDAQVVFSGFGLKGRDDLALLIGVKQGVVASDGQQVAAGDSASGTPEP